MKMSIKIYSGSFITVFIYKTCISWTDSYVHLFSIEIALATDWAYCISVRKYTLLLFYPIVVLMEQKVFEVSEYEKPMVLTWNKTKNVILSSVFAWSTGMRAMSNYK